MNSVSCLIGWSSRLIGVIWLLLASERGFSFGGVPEIQAMMEVSLDLSQASQSLDNDGVVWVFVGLYLVDTEISY